MFLVPIEILLINLLGGIDPSFIVYNLLFTPYVSISYVLGLQLIRKGNDWERAWGTVISVFAWALIALYGVLLISFVPEISQGTWALAFGAFMTGLAIVSHWEIRAYQDHRTDAATKDS